MKEMHDHNLICISSQAMVVAIMAVFIILVCALVIGIMPTHKKKKK